MLSFTLSIAGKLGDSGNSCNSCQTDGMILGFLGFLVGIVGRRCQLISEQGVYENDSPEDLFERRRVNKHSIHKPRALEAELKNCPLYCS